MNSNQFLEGKFLTRDGLKLHYRFFSTPNAENTLVIHHGHGEHSGRYEKFAKYLAQQRLNIALFDARGHGLSEGDPVFVHSFEDYIRDLNAYILFLQGQADLPGKFFLLGHSNGALVSIHWAIQNQHLLKALFLSSPYLGIRLPHWMLRFNDLVNKLAPKFVYKNPIYPPYLTHNFTELQQYKKDRLIRRRITSRLFSEMQLYQKKLKDVSKFKFNFPVFIMMAGMEKVVDGDETRQFFSKLEVPDKDLQVFEGFYHEIFNELGQEQVFECLKRYLERIDSPSNDIPRIS